MSLNINGSLFERNVNRFFTLSLTFAGLFAAKIFLDLYNLKKKTKKPKIKKTKKNTIKKGKKLE